jgi:type II secretory pathway pseudopilin PulG
MLFIAILALLLRFTIKQTIKATIVQNESKVSAILKSIAAALENYARDHQSLFPANFAALLYGPAYLDKNYLTNFPVKGYIFHCLRFESSGYNCVASPLKCNITGRTVFTITTGGIMLSEECGRRD